MKLMMRLGKGFLGRGGNRAMKQEGGLSEGVDARETVQTSHYAAEMNCYLWKQIEVGTGFTLDAIRSTSTQWDVSPLT